MKKIIIISILLITTFFNVNYVNATDTVSVVVSEKIPGANCSTLTEAGEENGLETPATYKCDISKGADGIVTMLGSIIKYFTFIASLVGVLFIVGNGIMYSMGGADQSLKDESKKRIIGTLIGLILLLLSGPILQLIAPWIYK